MWSGLFYKFCRWNVLHAKKDCPSFQFLSSVSERDLSEWHPKSIVFLKNYRAKTRQNIIDQMKDNFRLILLELIKDNHLIYSADGSDEESLEEFERIACALTDFEAAGLIEIQSKMSEIVNGKERLIFIAVGQLTKARIEELESRIR